MGPFVIVDWEMAVRIIIPLRQHDRRRNVQASYLVSCRIKVIWFKLQKLARTRKSRS